VLDSGELALDQEDRDELGDDTLDPEDSDELGDDALDRLEDGELPLDTDDADELGDDALDRLEELLLGSSSCNNTGAGGGVRWPPFGADTFAWEPTVFFVAFRFGCVVICRSPRLPYASCHRRVTQPSPASRSYNSVASPNRHTSQLEHTPPSMSNFINYLISR
jgi:hypothetical protein